MGIITIKVIATIGPVKDLETDIKVHQTLEIDQAVIMVIDTGLHPATKKEGTVHRTITSTKNKETGLGN